jgi:hypothetical protein
MKKEITLAEVEKKCSIHHRALYRGYVSRKSEHGAITPYNGKFGSGYTVARPNWDSSRYCFIEYWIEG